jgi:sn-glycerol 3-phosphate transport system substrate-binding protein
MRRSLLSLGAVLLLSVTLGACGGGEEGTATPETPGASPAAGPVSIDFWHSEVGSNEETLKRLVDRFNASQNEVRVRTSYQGTYQEATAKLIASLGTGSVPAVLGDGTAQMIIDSGAVTPIQDFVDRDGYDLSDLDEKGIQYYTSQGKLWAMPFAMDSSLLYYNKVAFREVGLDPERPPQDLEELRQYSEKLLKRDASGNVVRSGIALDIANWTERIFAEHGDLWVDKGNGHEGRATKVLFDNDTGRWFFQWWHDMVDEGLAFNVGRNPTYAEGFLAIASGRAAMTFSYPGALRSVIDTLEAGIEGVEVGISRLPGVPGGTGQPSFASLGFWILNVRPKAEQEAAWKFIKWLMEPEQQAEWFAGSGYLPASHSAIDLPAAQDIVARYPLFRVALDLYLNTPAMPGTVDALLGPRDQVREAVYTAVEEMLEGGKDPAQALEDAATRADEAIAEYNRRVGE